MGDDFARFLASGSPGDIEWDQGMFDQDFEKINRVGMGGEGKNFFGDVAGNGWGGEGVGGITEGDLEGMGECSFHSANEFGGEGK